ncbi:type I restriction-modification system subunit M [Bacteroides thetaiotaomicron]|uniref:type I restriction-modification system subunit M n=1 Tax=Bacteroides thetaiotaomicron TaxID=818 RepID=UPI001CE25CE0|nr:type I restriction-modification system subunit M [Bacteroides thetaiotaomicron]MCA6032401.1 type I restriction-modification system subunit M [Bacteroides thetaiotaomicron]
MNKQQLASKIWASANRMRSKIEANDYKDYILGFIFYKFLSDKEEAFLKKNDWVEADLPELTEEDEETVRYCQQQLGYFISYENLFSTWLKKGRDFDVSNVRDALSAFNRLISETHKKVFSKIFDTLQTGLSKLGDSAGSQTKSISDLIQVIKDIPTDGSQDYDVLGFIYEYLISNFAANAGKKAGEFYTPHEVSVVMSEIIANHLSSRDKIEIYDPTSGSGSLLINIGRSVAKHINDKNNIKYYAQELKENTYNLTRMNLVMRNILPDNIVVRNADTLEDDWPYFDDNDKERTYHPLYVDAVVSNPPYSQNWDPANKEADPRYSRFGLAPKGKADYAFLLHDLYHVKPDGIMTIVLPHGVLFRGGEEEKIRTNLIEFNHIDAIIGLPANIFFGTGIPTIIMVLKQRRDNDDVLIIDASKGFIKEGKNNRLRACDIKKIADAVIHRSDIPKFSKKVSRQTIRENGYNLNIPRYVDSSAEAESWDIYASMFGGIPNTEIDALSTYWAAFPTLRAELFAGNDTPYSALSAENVKETIVDNTDVQHFINRFDTAFAPLPAYLKEELIDNMLTLKVQQQENKISIDIFNRLADVPLIDKYQAYQLLDDQWTKTATDLEIIQTEGFEATKVVEPNMVIKKKDGKDEEVQDGWMGRVIPFELVQLTLLRPQYDELKQVEADLEKTLSEKDELLEKLIETGEGENLLNDDNTAFAAKEITKEAKALNKTKAKYAEDTLEYIIVTADALMTKEKKQKKAVKDQTAALHTLTKTTIENLADDDVLMLLDLKWIKPLCASLAELPSGIINELVAKTKLLAEKYAVTYMDLERDIQEAEQSLSLLIDDLEGSEFDMRGLKELQTLLGANVDGKE